MIFDPTLYADFVTRLRSAGITVPVIPGIKPVTSLKSLQALPGIFHIDIPESLVRRLENARTDAMERETGLEFTAELIERLYEAGAPCVHIFTMGKGRNTARLLERLHVNERN